MTSQIPNAAFICQMGDLNHAAPAHFQVEYTVALPPYGVTDFDTRTLLVCDQLACLHEANLHAEVVGCHHDTVPLTVAEAEDITGLVAS